MVWLVTVRGMDLGLAPLFSFLGEWAGDIVADEDVEEQSKDSSAQATFLKNKIKVKLMQCLEVALLVLISSHDFERQKVQLL